MFGNNVERMLGDPRRAILSMALIMALSLAAARVNIFVDTMWVSRMGVEATSAVFIVKPLYIMISCIGVGLGIGASTCISYHIGKGDAGKAERLASNALISGAILSVAMTVFLVFFITPIVLFMGGEDVKELAHQYMLPLALCASVLVAQGILLSLMKAEGAAGKAALQVLFGVVINIVLDPLLMFTVGMGLQGAAWQTCISVTCSVCLIMYWYRAGKMFLKIRFLRRPERSGMSEIMSVGIPKSFEEFMSGFILMLHRMILIVVSGIAAVTMHQLAFLYLDLLMIILDAIGSAALPVCSSAVGQKDQRRLKEGARFAVVLSLAVSGVCALLIYFLTGPLMSPFMNSDIRFYQETIVFAAKMYILFLPIYVLTKLTSYLLQQIRRSKEAAVGNFIIGLIKLQIFVVPVLVGTHLFLSVIWSVMAAYVAAGVFMIVLTQYYYRSLDFDNLVEKISGRSGADPSAA